jgi:hypothetical protein
MVNFLNLLCVLKIAHSYEFPIIISVSVGSSLSESLISELALLGLSKEGRGAVRCICGAFLLV